MIGCTPFAMIACGITTLDIDHTAILGSTVEEIAWHKAGIMKSGSIAFTDGNIPEVTIILYF